MTLVLPTMSSNSTRRSTFLICNSTCQLVRGSVFCSFSCSPLSIDSMQQKAPRGVFRLPSDVAIARSSITKCRFEVSCSLHHAYCILTTRHVSQAYAGNQQKFNDDFMAAMLKMSLISRTTKNVQHFTECTEAIPTPKIKLTSKLILPKG